MTYYHFGGTVDDYFLHYSYPPYPDPDQFDTAEEYQRKLTDCLNERIMKMNLYKADIKARS